MSPVCWWRRSLTRTEVHGVCWPGSVWTCPPSALGSNATLAHGSRRRGRRRGRGGAMSAEASRYRPFTISVERRGGEVAIVVAGDLDLASADRLEREVGQHRAADVTRLLI